MQDSSILDFRYWLAEFTAKGLPDRLKKLQFAVSTPSTDDEFAVWLYLCGKFGNPDFSWTVTALERYAGLRQAGQSVSAAWCKILQGLLNCSPESC